jgi:hypothetical protein
MAGCEQLQMTLLPGARALLGAHARELPQRDDLCGAFCGALALRAAAVPGRDGEPWDQDSVALAAGSIVSGPRPAGEPGGLPHGEAGRRDYRLALPTIDDSDVSGTTAAGVIDAIARLSDGALVAIPLSGPWTPAALGALFDAACALERVVTLIANFATHHLWGSRARLDELLDYAIDGVQAGPPPDWRVGHFACVVGRVSAPGGELYVVADTYPSLGDHGVHLQPGERLAAALERRDMPAGGMIAVVFAADADTLREAAREAGLEEGVWDNGTVTTEKLG